MSSLTIAGKATVVPSDLLAVTSICDRGSKSPEDGMSNSSVQSSPSESVSSPSGNVSGNTPMPTRFDL